MNLSTKPVYAIGVAAAKLNVSVHLLRVYENEGLILSERTPTGRRLYSDLELEKVRCIRNMIRYHGINFEGVRRLLALIPCWRLRNCDLSERRECQAFKRVDRPCWATEEKCYNPMDNCRNCEVYTSSVDCNQLKHLIFGTT